MASAKLLQPRGGDTVGVDGLELFEHFYVTVDAEGDSPISVLQDRLDDDPYDRTGVPIGQAHPVPVYALAQVRNYRVLEGTLGPLNSIVVVHYTTPEIPAVQTTFIPGWRFSTSVIGRTKRLLKDLDGKPIGGKLTKYEGTPQANDTYRAISPIEGKEITVKQTGGDDFSSPLSNAGIEIEDGIFAFTLRRTTLAMHTNKLRAAKSSLFKCNSANWRGYEPKTVMIADVHIEELDYFKQGSSRRNQYPVSVELWQADKDWTTEELPLFYTEEGHAAPVYENTGDAENPRRLVTRQHRVRGTIDLAGFLHQFEGFDP